MEGYTMFMNENHKYYKDANSSPNKYIQSNYNSSHKNFLW